MNIGEYLENHKKKKETPDEQGKFGLVMGEFKHGGLKSSSGQKVTSPDQAKAIAASESGISKKKKEWY